MEQVFQADVAIHLAAHAIADRVDDLRVVLRRNDVDALAERKIDNANDLACDVRGIGVGGLEAGETLQRFFRYSGIGTGFVFGYSRALTK